MLLIGIKDIIQFDESFKYMYMNELINKITELSAALVEDATAQVEKGNKAAGTRARKASLELEKVLKEFRKVSLEESKK